jgi:hypothetical protein
MFTRPQILSTPHFVSNMQDMDGLACNYGFSQTCPVSFSCSPYSGSCTDSTYVGGAIAIVSIIGVVGTVVGAAVAK